MRYEYKCKKCGAKVEYVMSLLEYIGFQKFCSECGSPDLQRIWNNPGIEYKGKGFYSKDSKKDVRNK
jgi:putative FmdB family regulatory protein